MTSFESGNERSCSRRVAGQELFCDSPESWMGSGKVGIEIFCFKGNTLSCEGREIDDGPAIFSRGRWLKRTRASAAISTSELSLYFVEHCGPESRSGELCCELKSKASSTSEKSEIVAVRGGASSTSVGNE